jgi:hypothetical protein
MRVLILFLQLFTSAFGTTQPKPEEERKYAWFLFALLTCMALAVTVVVYVIFQNTR